MAIAKECCPAFTIQPENKAKIRQIYYWCIRHPEGKLNPDVGLWIWGNIGSGKSTLLQIIKEFCKAIGRKDFEGNQYSFRISNVENDVCAAYKAENTAGLQEYITSRRQAFDDLGCESIPALHFGNQLNVMQYILQARYDRRHTGFTHVTTNLDPNQIIEFYGERVYDRCLEMFNFVEISGTSNRPTNGNI